MATKQTEEVKKILDNFNAMQTSLYIEYGNYRESELKQADGALKEEVVQQLRQLFELKGDAGRLLTEEEIKKAENIFVPPTPEEWAIKPDHQYWRDIRKLKAQRDLTASLVIQEKDAECQQKLEALFDEMICPMCYRLNPQHESMDDGKGCHWCQEKEDWLAQYSKEETE